MGAVAWDRGDVWGVEKKKRDEVVKGLLVPARRKHIRAEYISI